MEFATILGLTQRNPVLNSLDRYLDLVLSAFPTSVSRVLKPLVVEHPYHPALDICCVPEPLLKRRPTVLNVIMVNAISRDLNVN